MQTFFYSKRFSRRIKINSEVTECIAGVPVNDRTCNDDDEASELHKISAQIEKLQAKLILQCTGDACRQIRVGVCLQVLWTGKIFFIQSFNSKLPLDILSPTLSYQNKHEALFKLSSCQWRVIPFCPLCVLVPIQPCSFRHFPSSLKTMTFNCWIIHKRRKKETLPWRVIYTE